MRRAGARHAIPAIVVPFTLYSLPKKRSVEGIRYSFVQTLAGQAAVCYDSDAKFARNKARDKANVKKLEKLGWRVIIVWECELKRLDELDERLRLEISGAS